jgi:hypothetical protein
MNNIKHTALAITLGLGISSAEVYNSSVEYYGLTQEAWTSKPTQVGGAVKVGMYARSPGIGYAKEILVHFDPSAFQGEIENIELTAHVTYANPGWAWQSFIPQIKVFEQDRYNLSNGIPLWGSMPHANWTSPVIVEEVSSDNANSDLILSGPAFTQLVKDWKSGSKTNNGIILGGDFKHETRYMTITSMNIEVTTDYEDVVVPTLTENILSFEDATLWTPGNNVDTLTSTTAFHGSTSLNITTGGETQLITSNTIPGGSITNVGQNVSVKVQSNITLPLEMTININNQVVSLGTGVFVPVQDWNVMSYPLPTALIDLINQGLEFSISFNNPTAANESFLIDNIIF